MRSVAMLCAAIAMMSASVAEAQAQQEGRTRRGQGGKVGEHYHIDPNGCQSGRVPVMTVRQRPRLGTLSFVQRTIPVPGGFFGGPCAGKPVRATIAVYRAGQRAGRDEFAYDFRFPQAVGGAGGSKRVAVTIE
jgi:hypothetical protein